MHFYGRTSKLYTWYDTFYGRTRKYAWSWYIILSKYQIYFAMVHPMVELTKIHYYSIFHRRNATCIVMIHSVVELLWYILRSNYHICIAMVHSMFINISLWYILWSGMHCYAYGKFYGHTICVAVVHSVVIIVFLWCTTSS